VAFEIRFRICGVLFSWMLLWTALASAAYAQEPDITEKSVFSFYKSLARLTPEPILVSPELAVKCTRPSVAERAADEQRVGPHSDTLINIYVNELAKRAIKEKAGSFPSGAVIVKEKLEYDVFSDPAVAVGGMIKRAPGYDPANGDWEYFYAAKSGGFATGRLDNCIGCHSQASARDHVFLTGIGAGR
jgi:hypothetical protein